MRILQLDDWCAIEFSGEDRIGFLQGQLTQDLHRLAAAASPLAGWCNARGRLEALGQLLPAPDRIYWLLPADIAAPTVEAIGRFRLRARVNIEPSPLAVYGLLELPEPARVGAVDLSGDSACAGGLLAARVAGDPRRAWLLASEASELPGRVVGAGAHWELADLRAGIPTIHAATAGAFVPQMVNLDLLDGISFSKGCYLGQEVVARTQHLGRIKRRMFRFRSAAATEAGETLQTPAGETAGRVVRCAPAGEDWELLAVVPLDRAGGPLQLAAGGPTLTRLPLPYPVPGEPA